MDIEQLQQLDEFTWCIEPRAKMRVPAYLYGSRTLIEEMDEKVRQQLCNVATLPGIVEAAFAMPDAHWGYGFPIGGVAAFDPEADGVVSAGGVGFDISCGVRTLTTGLKRAQIEPLKRRLADALAGGIPAGLGSTGQIRLDHKGMAAMLAGGAQWAVEQGWGLTEDLPRIEEQGRMPGADPGKVSKQAKKRQLGEMGTLGSGNHYLELQEVVEIYDEAAGQAFGLGRGDIVISIHCGSRGLGHQIGTEYLSEMVTQAAYHGIDLPDRELACAPIGSELGQAYLGAMAAGINCALANRQILTHLTREIFARLLPEAVLALLYDVSHNTCKLEHHRVQGASRPLFVHRKGATRAFGAGHPELPAQFQSVGQPVLIGGSMGTASYILAGNASSGQRSYFSACHGAGRSMSRHRAKKLWTGRQVLAELEQRGILVRSPSLRGVAEEAPGAYKDVSAVVAATEQAGLARRVARLKPVICIKG